MSRPAGAGALLERTESLRAVGGSGTWAEEVIVPARASFRFRPDSSDEQAATFFINPATAARPTRHVHRLRAGEWVVQTAANSQVGRMVIRLGTMAGFRTVNLVRRAEQGRDPAGASAGDVCLVHDPESAGPESLKSQIEAQVGPIAASPRDRSRRRADGVNGAFAAGRAAGSWPTAASTSAARDSFPSA